MFYIFVFFFSTECVGVYSIDNVFVCCCLIEFNSLITFLCVYWFSPFLQLVFLESHSTWADNIFEWFDRPREPSFILKIERHESHHNAKPVHLLWSVHINRFVTANAHTLTLAHAHGANGKTTTINQFVFFSLSSEKLTTQFSCVLPV